MTVAHELQTVRKTSLYDEAHREAERHKWIESQKHGRDLGETAIRDWYQVYWLDYCRRKRMEHIRGSRCWQEFGDEDFGRIDSIRDTEKSLVDRILDRVDAGQENLDIINWALEWGLPMDRVVEILSQLDVNRARLEPDGK